MPTIRAGHEWYNRAVRRLLAAAAVGLASLVSPAAAQAPTWTATAQPSQAAKQSRITVTASGSANSGQSVPQGITLALFKGFTLDLGAVAERCTSTASPPSCPPGSQIATGQFSGSGSYMGFSRNFSGTIQAYLAPPSSGDLADVIVVVNVSGLGSGSARGQLVSVSDPTFGYELRFDPLPSGMIPPGASATINQLTLTAGAMRTTSVAANHRHKARKKHRTKACRRHGRHCRRASRRTRHRAVKAAQGQTLSLLTNPASCPGSWPLEVRVRYSDHTDVRDTPIACTA